MYNFWTLLTVRLPSYLISIKALKIPTRPSAIRRFKNRVRANGVNLSQICAKENEISSSQRRFELTDLVLAGF